jgi:hypothetical protein
MVYLSEIDVSIDNGGRGINEREFVRSLVEAFPDEATCIFPGRSIQTASPWAWSASTGLSGIPGSWPRSGTSTPSSRQSLGFGGRTSRC